MARRQWRADGQYPEGLSIEIAELQDSIFPNRCKEKENLGEILLGDELEQAHLRLVRTR